MIGDAEEMKKKLDEYESTNQRLMLQQKTLEHELKLADKDKNAVEFIKEELKQAKSKLCLEQMELDKEKDINCDLSDKLAKLEQRYSNLE